MRPAIFRSIARESTGRPVQARVVGMILAQLTSAANFASRAGSWYACRSTRGRPRVDAELTGIGFELADHAHSLWLADHAHSLWMCACRLQQVRRKRALIDFGFLSGIKKICPRVQVNMLA